MIEDTWRTFLQSPTFYGFGTASVPPFSWGLHRKDREGDAATAELVFRRMLQEWEIPPDVATYFIGAADEAFRRVQKVIPLATLNALEKPGYMCNICRKTNSAVAASTSRSFRYNPHGNGGTGAVPNP